MQPHIPSDLASVVACGDLCGDCGCGESTWPSPELSIRKLFIPVCGQSFAGTHTHTRTHAHTHDVDSDMYAQGHTRRKHLGVSKYDV